VTLPNGYPPRAAVGYSLAVILTLLGRLKLVKPKSKELKVTASFLNQLCRQYSVGKSTADNPAKQLAAKLSGKVPIIYAGEDYFFSVALRWKQQICENAKILTFCNAFPEFNHNELAGWEQSATLAEKLAVIVLRDRQDHKRIQVRMEIVKKILQEKQIEVMEIDSSGKTLLERMHSLVLLGDWVSYYLAILDQVDPTPIVAIDYLKRSLEEAR
jgi:glucose/mannose-6-phosphate isomerase